MQKNINFESLNFEDCVDRGLLEKLHTLLQHKPFGDLLETFSDRARTNIEKAGVNLRTENLEELRFVMHGLKGSSANVGATRLSKLCAGFEDKLKKGSAVSELQSAYNDIVAMYDVSRQFMLQFYNDVQDSGDAMDSNVA